MNKYLSGDECLKYFQKLEAENAEFKKHQNSKHTQIVCSLIAKNNKIAELEAENAELKRDSERLDYLLGVVIRKPCDTADRYVFCDDENTYIGDSPREAIDEAMKNGG